jgi:hypothetical protein
MKTCCFLKDGGSTKQGGMVSKKTKEELGI